MFDLHNELQYRFGTQGADEGKIRKNTAGHYDIGLLGRMLGVTPQMMEVAGNDFDRRTYAASPPRWP